MQRQMKSIDFQSWFLCDVLKLASIAHTASQTFLETKVSKYTGENDKQHTTKTNNNGKMNSYRNICMDFIFFAIFTNEPASQLICGRLWDLETFVLLWKCFFQQIQIRLQRLAACHFVNVSILRRLYE